MWSKEEIEYLIKVEPYWNVNLYILTVSNSLYHIKVEPYWNVNNKWELKHRVIWEIKVEPYWNVNGTNRDFKNSHK